MWEKKALTKPQPLGMIKTLRNLRLVGNFLRYRASMKKL